MFACTIVVFTLAFVFNNFLIFWLDWPGALAFLQHKQWFGLGPPEAALEGVQVTLGWLQILSYTGAVLYIAAYVLLTPTQPLPSDARHLCAISAFLVRTFFWFVFISGAIWLGATYPLPGAWSEHASGTLPFPDHGPGNTSIYLAVLVAASVLVGRTVRLGSLYWLLLMVLAVELVNIILGHTYPGGGSPWTTHSRAWYLALLLVAVMHQAAAHGRVPIESGTAQARGGSWMRIVFIITLGLPLCGAVLLAGMWTDAGTINMPLLKLHEYTPGPAAPVDFLAAVTVTVLSTFMTIQLAGRFLYHAANLREQVTPGGENETADESITVGVRESATRAD